MFSMHHSDFKITKPYHLQKHVTGLVYSQIEINYTLIFNFFLGGGGVQGQGSVKMFDNQLHIGKVYKINVLYNYYQNKSKIKNHKLPL